LSTTKPAPPVSASRAAVNRLPRIGFLGAGWIGRHRMLSLARSGLVAPVAVADSDARACEQAVTELGDRDAIALATLEELLEPGLRLDGIVIATPSALHAEQAIAALDHGLAVFCQKPLARTAPETRSVIEAARRADRLLAVDLSYRDTAAVRAMQAVIGRGELGHLYAADLVFHNASGPDKEWFTERRLAGGGCLIDLGTHLLDLLLWLTDAHGATVQAARMLRGGRPVPRGSDEVEDFAAAQLETDTGLVARLACSWFLPAGRDCVIELSIYGTEGSVAMRNIRGSFYDFVATHRRGTHSDVLARPPDDWGGRAIAAWATRLAANNGYDSAAGELEALAGLIDGVYAAGGIHLDRSQGANT
jgi:predicted dehydrogenase